MHPVIPFLIHPLSTLVTPFPSQSPFISVSRHHLFHPLDPIPYFLNTYCPTPSSHLLTHKTSFHHFKLTFSPIIHFQDHGHFCFLQNHSWKESSKCQLVYNQRPSLLMACLGYAWEGDKYHTISYTFVRLIMPCMMCKEKYLLSCDDDHLVG